MCIVAELAIAPMLAFNLQRPMFIQPQAHSKGGVENPALVELDVIVPHLAAALVFFVGQTRSRAG